MRKVLVFVTVGMCLQPEWASAQPVVNSKMVDGCITATRIFLVDQNIAPETVQDFSELDPPRVRLGMALADVECKFSGEPTVELVDFCLRGNCFAGNPYLAPRLEEMQFLLRKEGF